MSLYIYFSFYSMPGTVGVRHKLRCRGCRAGIFNWIREIRTFTTSQWRWRQLIKELLGFLLSTVDFPKITAHSFLHPSCFGERKIETLPLRLIPCEIWTTQRTSFHLSIVSFIVNFFALTLETGSYLTYLFISFSVFLSSWDTVFLLPLMLSIIYSLIEQMISDENRGQGLF